MTVIEWRPIPGLPYEAGSNGQIRHAINQKPRKAHQNYKGYLYVGIRVNGKSKSLAVHRLICAAFNGECPPGHQCAHLNGNQIDNRPQNLAWATPQENIDQAEAHGTIRRGARHPQARLTRAQLEEIIFRVGRRHERQADVAGVFGVAQATISEIMTCKIYSSEWGMRP